MMVSFAFSGLGGSVHFPSGGADSRVTASPNDRDQGGIGSNLELGELSQLTITNDNESTYDVRSKRTDIRCDVTSD